jgi:hypothetical protein
VLTLKVNRYGLVGVRQSHYSVPARFIVFDGRTEIARHERSVVRKSQTFVLDHYLEVMLRKPGALPRSTALAQAAAVKAHGDADGTRAFIDVLLPHRLDGLNRGHGLGEPLTARAGEEDLLGAAVRSRSRRC